MIEKSLTLEYRLPAGWLKPWVDGLLAGRAIGRSCTSCESVSFAPVRVCECGSTNGSWIELPGTASIVHRTDGLDGSFALAKFDGAQTNCVVQLNNLPTDATRGRLAAADTGVPAIVLAGLKQDEAS